LNNLILLPANVWIEDLNKNYLILTDNSLNSIYENSINLPYHWNDRKKLYKDHLFILELYETYLKKVSVTLNLKHDMNMSNEYWRLIVGPWLYYFIAIVVDRYEMVRIASKEFDIKHAQIPKYIQDEWVPIDYIDFNEKFYTDEWNYYIFSEIIKKTKLVAIEESKDHLIPVSFRKTGKRTSLIKLILFFLTRLTRRIRRRILFVEMDIPQKNLYKLLYRLKSISFSYYLRVRPNFHKIDHHKRENFLGKSKKDDALKVILDVLIPENIPTSYLEGFNEIKDMASKIFPRQVDLVLTSNAYFSNELFKFWVANQKLKGTKLWVMVHGGHHGTALFNGPGELTEEIADRFYSWGWGKYNLPSPKLSKLRKFKIKTNKDNILFIPYSVSIYSNHIDSSPIASSFNDCLKMHCNFFEKLQKLNLDHRLMIRIKEDKTLTNIEKVYSEYISTEYIYSHKESLLESISKSGLTIVTYDSTVFLESLTLNHPTCLFIRKEFWEMSKDSQPYFDQLVECGIVHYDEITLTNHILKFQDNYSGWWNKEEVQIAIKSFLHRFGLSNDHWDEDWYNEIDLYLKNIGKS